MDDVELDQQINDLERRLTELRRERNGRHPATPWQSPKGADEAGPAFEGDPFVIRSATELDLAALPDLARMILNALPVQVFLKKDKIEEKGRKYTYLNKTARDLSNWSEEDLSIKYDSDVFSDKALYQKMQEQETKTISSGKSRLTTTDWVQSSNRWSRNSNVEIPILLLDGARIGFCSIAQDLVFRELPKEWALYLKSTQHLFFNLMVRLTNPLTQANILLDQLKSKSEPVVKADLLKGVEAQLKLIEQRLVIADRTGRIQIEALESIGSSSAPLSAGEVAETIKRTYEDCGFDFICEISERAAKARLLHPQVVKAMLTVLINNSVKYSEEVRAIAECRVHCDVSDVVVVWEVSNPCDEKRGKLKMDFSGRPSLKEVEAKGFDGLMIWTLVNHAFPGKTAEQMVPPLKYHESRASACLLSEVAPDAEAGD